MKSNKISYDSYLWDEVRKGNVTALNEIFKNHIQILINYGIKFTYDKQLVEDCIQDIFMGIFRNHKNLSPTDNIKLYLLKSLRRKIVKELQKNNNKLFNEEQDISFEPIYEYQSSEDSDVIINTLNKLTSRQKELILLKFYEDLEYDDICQIMNMNYQSVRNLMCRTIQKLRSAAISKAILNSI